LAEEEIRIIIEQLKQLPIPDSEKVKALEEILKERGITDTRPYVDLLLS
jgi:hypothetical protein